LLIGKRGFKMKHYHFVAVLNCILLQNICSLFRVIITWRSTILYSFVNGNILRRQSTNSTESDLSLVALGKELVSLALLGLLSNKQFVAYKQF
jgi:hypothetical protein